MSDFIRFSIPTMAHEAVQSLQEARRLARSLEATVDSLIPVVESTEAAAQLEEIREMAMKASEVLRRLYNRNAKETFGPGVTPSNLASGKGTASGPEVKTNE